MPQQLIARSFLLRLARRSYSLAQTTSSSSWIGISVGFLLATAALAVRFWIGDVLTGFPFLTFFLAVALASFFFGWRAGLSCGVLGGVLAWAYLIKPDEAVTITAPAAALALGFYTFTTGTFVVLTAAMHSSFGAFDRLTSELEERVVQRTAHLEQINEKLTAEIEGRFIAETQVRQLQKMEALGQLTGGMAHDFNNMLAVIIGALGILTRRIAKGETDVARYIEPAMDAARRAASLTERLLAFSRQQPLSPVPVDANRLVAGMSEILNRTLGAPVKLETVLAAGLWRASVDPNQLENSLINLAVNARDAMPLGGRLTIETGNAHFDEASAKQSDVRAGQYVMIAVTDTGAGMTTETMSKAFDPFFTTKGVGKGTGLGLSQVFGFSRQSSGHVKIYSEVGVGTTVKIYLPRTQEEENAETTRRPKLGQQPPRGAEVVLVVEDDARVRGQTVEQLRELGYRVLEAASGVEALTLLEGGEKIDLLFTDVVMPDMNGKQLADRATEAFPGLQVLYTTGYTRNAVVHNGTLDPGIALLQKPFNFEDLAEKIREVLGSRPK